MTNQATTYNATELALMSDIPSPPFQLRLGDSTWLCLAVLRYLPNKRIVLKLQKADNTVLCKIFHRQKDYLREVHSQQYITDKQVSSPALLQQQQLDQNCWSLQYLFIDAPSLAEQFNTADDSGKQQLLLAACRLVANMHSQGLYQQDIHLDNFLNENETLWVIDTAAIVYKDKPIAKQTAINNVALLLAQTPHKHLPALSSICTQYNQHNSNITINEGDLTTATEEMRLYRWNHYRKKIFRSCTEFVANKTWQRFSVTRNDQLTSALQDKLNNIDQWLESGTTLKNGNTATVAKVSCDDKSFVIKRYNIKNWRHAISRALRPSRAWLSWRNGNYLRFNDIATPQPIALIEERLGPLRGRAWLVTTHSDSKDLLTTVNGSESSSLQLPQQTANIINELSKANCSHGDMKATNLLVTNGKLELIDLDAMQIHANNKSARASLRRDVARLLRNWDIPSVQKEFHSAIAQQNSELLPTGDV